MRKHTATWAIEKELVLGRLSWKLRLDVYVRFLQETDKEMTMKFFVGYHLAARTVFTSRWHIEYKRKRARRSNLFKGEDISSCSIHGLLKPLNDKQYGTPGRQNASFQCTITALRFTQYANK
jgi:hypothetical protein